MALYDDIWGERRFFDLSKADNDYDFFNFPRESPLVLSEDKIEEDKGTSMIYNDDRLSDNVYPSYAREVRDQEVETQSIMPIDTNFEESVGNIQGSTTSLPLVRSPAIDFPGISSHHYQNNSTCATKPPPFNTISNTIRQPAMLERSSALPSSFLSDKDNRHEYKHGEDLSYSLMTSRPCSRRREKNSIDTIIEEHNKKKAGKLGVTKINSKPLAPKVIQKKATKYKGYKYFGSLEGFMVECQEQRSGSSLSGIYQEYQVDHDKPTTSWMCEEENSFQQVGQAQEVPQSVDYIQHMGQGMIRPFTHEVQQFDYYFTPLPSPQRIDTQQPNYSFQQMGHSYHDWGSYPFNCVSVLDEPHSPLFPERNLWAPRATETLSNQSHHRFQMPTVQAQGLETQQYTTVSIYITQDGQFRDN